MAGDSFDVHWHAAHDDYLHKTCTKAAEISFTQPQRFQAQKTADGIAWTIPVEVDVREEPPFQLSHMRAIVYQRGVEARHSARLSNLPLWRQKVCATGRATLGAHHPAHRACSLGRAGIAGVRMVL